MEAEEKKHEQAKWGHRIILKLPIGRSQFHYKCFLCGWAF
jgi:hypothetical protein